MFDDLNEKIRDIISAQGAIRRLKNAVSRSTNETFNQLANIEIISLEVHLNAINKFINTRHL